MKFKKTVKNVLLLFLLASITILPQKKLAKINSSSDQLAIPKFAKFNCNNISTIIYANGQADNDLLTGNAGFQFPALSGKTLVYESGLILGGIVDGEIRLTGSMFSSWLVPGKILSNENPDDPELTSVRVFRVRPDYKKGKLSTEIKDEGKDSISIYKQYEKDWDEWPAESGAPFEDKNMNGKYEPFIDIPGVPGADQTLWFVANDLDISTAQQFLGTIGLGVEMQTTIWGYKKGDFLDNIVFKKYKIINKNKDKDTIKNAYLGYWSDADIGGDAGDDLVGCDTTLQMGFMYNGKDIDTMYKNEAAAYGSMLINGPWDKDKKKYLSINAFSTCEWSVEMYIENMVRAPVEKTYYYFLKGLDEWGRNIVNPVTNAVNKFIYLGDPFFLSGWNCAVRKDYRTLISTGPFDLAYGDSKEIVIAQIAATYRIRLEAQQRVIGFGILARTYYYENLLDKVLTNATNEKNENIPTQFILHQNYPNPFNPSTAISYQLSASSYVTLKIYDLLGREITTLVNEYKQPGNYEVKFDAHHFERNREIPSGIYFYSLKAGKFAETKKMVLMK